MGQSQDKLGGGISDQEELDAGGIHDSRGPGVVTGQYAEFLTGPFALLEVLETDFIYPIHKLLAYVRGRTITRRPPLALGSK